MKKTPSILIFSTFCLLLTFNLASSTTLTINSLKNQELYITPIKTTETFEKIDTTKLLKTNEDGKLTINLELNEPFDLMVKIKNNEKTTRIFRENFSLNDVKELNIFPNTQNKNPTKEILVEKKENIPTFLITGHAIYTKNKNLIIPVYYSLIAFLSLILLLNIIFKKSKETLIEEAKELLEKEETNHNEKNTEALKEEKEKIAENQKKEEMESIPEIETKDNNNNIKDKVEKKETEIDDKEVFKESEEKLVSEVKKEIKEEKKEPKAKEDEGQPTPLNVDTGEAEDKKKLIDKAEELEKK